MARVCACANACPSGDVIVEMAAVTLNNGQRAVKQLQPLYACCTLPWCTAAAAFAPCIGLCARLLRSASCISSSLQ
jgi:hypothetical protein